MIAAGGTAPAVFNAANEIAVAAFLDQRIGFLDIAASVEEVLQRSVDDPDMPKGVTSFDDVYAIDARSRELARNLIPVSGQPRARIPVT